MGGEGAWLRPARKHVPAVYTKRVGVGGRPEEQVPLLVAPGDCQRRFAFEPAAALGFSSNLTSLSQADFEPAAALAFSSNLTSLSQADFEAALEPIYGDTWMTQLANAVGQPNLAPFPQAQQPTGGMGDLGWFGEYLATQNW